jgi:uncharacterized membrane protein YkoI
MRTRNALVFAIATVLSAAVAGAQQPKPAATKPAATAKSTAPAQAPAAKPAQKTPAAAALPINADSAKKIVMANAAGATISSARLHKSAGKAYYNVAYKMKGEKKTMHATVDANTGAFATVAPAAKPTTKKPS